MLLLLPAFETWSFHVLCGFVWFWYAKQFCEFASWLRKSKVWVCLIFTFREGTMHLELFCCWVLARQHQRLACQHPNSQPCDSVFCLHLCPWTLWEKMCNAGVQLRTEGDLDWHQPLCCTHRTLLYDLHKWNTSPCFPGSGRVRYFCCYRWCNVSTLFNPFIMELLHVV